MCLWCFCKRCSWMFYSNDKRVIPVPSFPQRCTGGWVIQQIGHRLDSLQPSVLSKCSWAGLIWEHRRHKHETYMLMKEMPSLLCLCNIRCVNILCFSCGRPHGCFRFGPTGCFSPPNSPRPQSHCPFLWEANIWLMTLACLRFASWGFPPGLSSPPHSLITSTPALGGTHRTKTSLMKYDEMWLLHCQRRKSFQPQQNAVKMFKPKQWCVERPVVLRKRTAFLIRQGLYTSLLIGKHLWHNKPHERRRLLHAVLRKHVVHPGNRSKTLHAIFPTLHTASCYWVGATHPLPKGWRTETSRTQKNTKKIQSEGSVFADKYTATHF